jgi:hypothetical protein
MRRYGQDASGLAQGYIAGSSEHSNEPSHSIKGGKFLDYMSDY